MIEFRPFDENDWMAYQGAELNPIDSSPPRRADIVVTGIAECGGAEGAGDVVHDANGIGIHVPIPEPKLDIIVYYLGLEPGDRCDAVLSLLLPRMTEAMLLALGFEKQVC